MDYFIRYFSELPDMWPLFMAGFVATLQLLVISGTFAFVIGLVVAAFRVSPLGVLRTSGAVYTEIVRNIPLTLIFVFTAVILPTLGLTLIEFQEGKWFVYAIIALSLYTSPFVAEAVRSGFNGVPVGQAEAARSIGLKFGQTLSLVVMPQALRMTIPPLINVFIALTKNTSVAGGFAVAELFSKSGALIERWGNFPILILLTTAILYLVITVPLGQIAGYVERKVAVVR